LAKIAQFAFTLPKSEDEALKSQRKEKILLPIQINSTGAKLRKSMDFSALDFPPVASADGSLPAQISGANPK
jgi:hypothetical protein